MARRQRRSVLLAGLLACAAARAQVPGFPPPLKEDPPPPGVLLDCSHHRYGDQLDEALATAVKRFVALRSTSTLQAAMRSGTRTDVTDFLYRQGLVRHVDGCAQPVVRGYVKGSALQLQLIAVPRERCLQLQDSPALHAAGIDVLPVHDPTGEPRCGMDRNPMPRILVFPFDARRMLPGNNTVTMVADYAPDCPTVDRNPDPMIEKIIKEQSRIETDFPKRWTSPACIDWIGGASSMGVCTTAEWDNYHNRLSEEFERILNAAVASREVALRVELVYSAAFWLIDKSDPNKFTIRGYDYKGRACDMLRNRIVAAWGLCATDVVKDKFWAAARLLSGGDELKKLWDETLEDAARCVTKIPEEYKDANDMIDALTRPMPFTAKRFEVLEKVQGDVQAAMHRLGKGNCPYYGEAVLRLDYVRWKLQYRGGLTTSPPDWEHDFWDAAAKCAAGR